MPVSTTQSGEPIHLGDARDAQELGDAALVSSKLPMGDGLLHDAELIPEVGLVETLTISSCANPFLQFHPEIVNEL